MVNIVGRTDAVNDTQQIVDGSKDIILGDMLRNELIAAGLDRLLPAVSGHGFEHLTQHTEADLLFNAVLLRIKVDEILHIDHAVGEYDKILAVNADDSAADTACRDLARLFTVQRLTVHGKNLAGHGVSYRLRKRLAGQARPDVHLLVELIPADL